MSTTARKLRKRSGVKFVHPAKVGTPLEDRSSQPVMRPNGDFAPSRRKAAKLAKQIAVRDAVEFNPSEALPLDPKPYRVGRKRFATSGEGYNEALQNEGELVFSPRKDFNKDRAVYPSILG